MSVKPFHPQNPAIHRQFKTTPQICLPACAIAAHICIVKTKNNHENYLTYIDQSRGSTLPGACCKHPALVRPSY